ncbi:MAG: Rrf2 family transcriptional regulator [Actinomycetota bacterium]|nr:Rrf2 family transcriptional regulator [Actinomycetota bacterium]
MWIARRTDYAARAVLALASTADPAPLNIETLSRRTAVPRSVLEQVMPALRSAGIVRSQRGAAGGYRLNKDPADITLERIVRLFQGPLAPIGCATRKAADDCPMTPGCSMQTVWQEVRDATIRILESTTFADLADRATGPWQTGLPLYDPPAQPTGRR